MSDRVLKKLVGLFKDLGLDKAELQTLEEALRRFKEESREAKLIRPIVSIEEWVSSRYYLGSTADYIYPFWRDELVKIWNAEDFKNLIIVSAALGTGKSTFAVLIGMRLVYEYSCYESFYNLFNMAPITLYSILYFSVNRTQAEMGGWSMFKAWLDDSPYFRDHFQRDRVESIISFGERHLFITYGSLPSHAIGFSVIYTIIDEASFMDGDSGVRPISAEETNRKASVLFRALRSRNASRFLKDGVVRSRIALVSSPSYEGSFVQSELEKHLSDPNCYIIEGSSWDIKPELYDPERFLVFKGSTQQEASVIESADHMYEILDREGVVTTKVRSLSDYYKSLEASVQRLFLLVPLELEQNFKEDVIGSLKDLGGVSVSSTGRLFTNQAAYDKSLDNGLRHPFTRETFVISTAPRSLRVQDFLIDGFEFPDKDEPHYIHIDQGVTTNFYGMAMVHHKGHVYNEVTQMALPIIVQDFVLEIAPPAKPDEIDLGKCLEFCIYLKRELGINIAKVTFDTYQSTLPKQILQAAGIPAETFSVSRKDSHYVDYVNLISSGRLQQYYYKRHRAGLFGAVHYRSKGKVELQRFEDGSHSDSFEAAVGAVVTCLGDISYAYEDPTAYESDFRSMNELPYQREIDFFKRLRGEYRTLKKK